MAYDSIITIGGQSFVDGFWRLMGPALQQAMEPIPVVIPGFSNSRLRITNLVPVYPSNTGGNSLEVILLAELTGEALFQVTVEADGVTISLGPQTFNIQNLTGSLGLPASTSTLSNLQFTGTALNLTSAAGSLSLPLIQGTLADLAGLSTGTLDLPAQTGTTTPLDFTGSTLDIGTGTGTLNASAVTATISNIAGAGTINLPGSITVPSIPLPTMVPIAVDLTPGANYIMRANLRVFNNTPSLNTQSGVLFGTWGVSVTELINVPDLATAVLPNLQAGLDQVVDQIGLPAGLVQPTLDPAKITDLVAPIPGIVSAEIDQALTTLLAETGRLLYPEASTGASCDARALPSIADVTLFPAANNGMSLHMGFGRSGSTDFPTLPPPPTGAVEAQVRVGNNFLLGLLSCLIERLPNFAFPFGGTFATTDIAGGAHTQCVNFEYVTAHFGPFSVGGSQGEGISICMDGSGQSEKTFSIVGKFRESVSVSAPIFSSITIGYLSISFTLPVKFDFDDAATLGNLALRDRPTVDAKITPSYSILFIILALVLIAVAILGVTGNWIGAAVLAIMSPLAAVIVTLVIVVALGLVSFFLKKAVLATLSGAALLRSPSALPPGILEAFGRLSPASMTIDDLEANGVMHTPTAPWGLLPRIGQIIKRKDKPPKEEKVKKERDKDESKNRHEPE